MIRVRPGQVVKIERYADGVATVQVEVDGERGSAINYDDLTGPVSIGDRVILNTTASHLGLGTGGNHFIMGVVGSSTELDSPGHIMKCRYTPSQTAVLAVEEPDSPHHDVMQDGDLAGTPVVVATLHSMVPAAVVTVKAARPDARIVYIMSDGAALPAKMSRLVRELKEKGLLDAVITYGHAFGGDYEAVTIYSALLASRAVCGADLVVVAMGPGVVGTGTTWGASALEQGTIVDAVAVMGGRAIAAPRLSFADPRERHHGISHHSLTALGKVAARRCQVALPSLAAPERELVYAQLEDAGILQRHEVKEYPADHVLNLLRHYRLEVRTMGRSAAEDPGPFLSASAAALCALEG